MSGSVDIHCHILPGIDDGPQTIEESLDLAREAVDNGVTDIIATPHYKPFLFEFSSEDCARARTQLQAGLQEAGIPISIHLGAEILLDRDVLPRNLLSGEAPTLADSKYVLLEFPFVALPLYAHDLVFEIICAGFKPILAHPERNATIQGHPEKLEPFRESGCLTQINSTSLTGRLGRSSRKTAVELLKRGSVDIIASDAHLADDRGPNLKEAVAIAAKHVGQEAAEKMITETPQRILTGQ